MKRTALVTGASAGIGYETALQLAQAGFEVIAVARRRERLEALQKSSSQISILPMDIRSPSEDWKRALGERRIDVLVNNAGLARGRHSFEKIKESDWQEMFETNVAALIRLSQILIPQMLERDDGDIVNIGSIAGLFTYQNGSIYCATKSAVHALSQAWRQDFVGKNIRVTEICPGMVETEFSQVRYQDEALAKKVYEGMRPLRAQDIAEAIVWSLSRPRHVTIQNMLIMPTDQGGVGLVHRRSAQSL
jgi:3-hydroxy acid dehydrogenase/malonic semialdehyde reductase